MEPGTEQVVASPRQDLGAQLAWLAVGVGVALRIWEFSSLRPLYMDEKALLGNLVGVPIFEFGRVLSQDQLAPPGFLVVERLMVRLPMNVLASARLFPLFCGLATMLLIVPLARRYVDRLVRREDEWLFAHRFVAVEWINPDSRVAKAGIVVSAATPER